MEAQKQIQVQIDTVNVLQENQPKVGKKLQIRILTQNTVDNETISTSESLQSDIILNDQKVQIAENTTGLATTETTGEAGLHQEKKGIRFKVLNKVNQEKIQQSNVSQQSQQTQISTIETATTNILQQTQKLQHKEHYHSTYTPNLIDFSEDD